MKINQLLVRDRFFNRSQSFSLQILDQRNGSSLRVIEITDNGRNTLHPKLLHGPPPPLSGDDFILGVFHPHHDGLNDAMGFNGLAQFINLLVVKDRPGLIRTADDFINGDLFDLFSAASLGKPKQSGELFFHSVHYHLISL
ncbi:hypothetical protein D3C71_1169690 [compost metagenome]